MLSSSRYPPRPAINLSCKHGACVPHLVFGPISGVLAAATCTSSKNLSCNAGCLCQSSVRGCMRGVHEDRRSNLRPIQRFTQWL